jgi:hypothetical protein
VGPIVPDPVTWDPSLHSLTMGPEIVELDQRAVAPSYGHRSTLIIARWERRGVGNGVAGAMLGVNSDLREENGRYGGYSQLMAFSPGARADAPSRPFPLRDSKQLFRQLSRFLESNIRHLSLMSKRW